MFVYLIRNSSRGLDSFSLPGLDFLHERSNYIFNSLANPELEFLCLGVNLGFPIIIHSSLSRHFNSTNILINRNVNGKYFTFI